MADERDRVPPARSNASEPVDERGTELTEGGRALSIEPSSEGDLMRMGTISTADPAALPPDMDREDTFAEIDNRAADDARMAVRKQDHSAD
jgi:hypothetical protein